MGEHTVKAYGEALAELSNAVARMGGIVEQQVADAISGVVRRDTSLAQAVVAKDIRADDAHRDIEKRATRILALRQPLANDLREVIAAFKAAGELERVGDLAKSVSKRTLVLNQSDPIQITRSIERMGRIAQELLKDVLDAYTQRDVAKALAVWHRDEELDAYYTSLFRELLTYMMEDARTITPCAHLLFVAKNIERIGDHCTNVAEIVHYLITGEEIGRDRPKSDESTTPES
ncbi:MAG: phosphate signaling complex protein PhoU [Alphaproteobacteria bacterium]|nr:phosphate signaling complex protein PhoU [Alphaproteobacteria bacterium]